MRSYILFQFLFYLVTVTYIDGLSSPITPFTTYMFSIELLPNIADLCWNVDSNTSEIIFELHMKTTGYIAIGISPCIVSPSMVYDFCMILFDLFSK